MRLIQKVGRGFVNRRGIVICCVLMTTSFTLRPALAADSTGAITASSQALSIPGLFPAAGATGVCPDTPLRLTFSKPAALGAGGKILILDAADHSLVETIDVSVPTKTKSIGGIANYNYHPVIISGNEAAIYPEKTLDYGKSYEVTVEPGAFTNTLEIDKAAGWRFTTRAQPPAASGSRLTVASDGSGDFCTVQGAIDFLPAGNTTPTTIFIRNGTYTEMVVVNGKHALTFLGEDRKKTIIAYADNAKINPTGSPYRRGMFLVNRSNDFAIANLTLHNTTPKGGTQAEAIILTGSVNAHAIITGIDLYSFQDTLQINGQAYVSDCYIEGDVDFMWGSGPVFFENCECKSVNSKAYYTQIRNPAANHGFVYHHCTFDGRDGVSGNFLSRIDPGRFPASEVVLIDCVLTSSVGAAAWRFDVNNAGPDVHFWEYNSHVADGTRVDTAGRFAASKRLDKAADAEPIAHYADPVWVLGGNWNPAVASIFKAQPPKN